MSWVERSVQYAQRLLRLQNRVEKNTEEILELCQEMKNLISFTNQVVQAVRVTQLKIKHNQELNERDLQGLEQTLLQQLEIELLKLDKRFSLQSINLGVVDEYTSQQKSLPSKNERGEQ